MDKKEINSTKLTVHFVIMDVRRMFAAAGFFSSLRVEGFLTR